MEAQTRLRAWMLENGYSNVQLARELGFSYNYIYKIAIRQDKQIKDSFKFRFIERFGIEEARRVFDVAEPKPVAEPV
jgi:hypothetical protein